MSPPTTSPLHKELVQYKEVLQSIQQDHPRIFDSPHQLISVKEAIVNPLNAVTPSIIDEDQSDTSDSPTSDSASSSSSNAPTRPPPSLHSLGFKGNVSAILATTAGGFQIPPIYIVETDEFSHTWFHPLPIDKYSLPNGTAHPFTEQNWFQVGSSVIYITTRNMSIPDVRLSIMGSILKHISKTVGHEFFRHVSTVSTALCILTDPKFLNIEFDRSFFFQHYGCIVAQYPSITDFWIDPFHRESGYKFMLGIEEAVQKMDSYHLEERSSVKMKIMIAQQAFSTVTSSDIKNSFRDTGLWPMDFRFADPGVYRDLFYI